MPVFYFHIRNGQELVLDREGVQMPGLEAALEEAKSAAREILAERIRHGDVVDGHEFEVHDAAGAKLFTLPFRSVIRLE